MAAQDAALKNLPQWDLSALYDGIESPAVAADLDRALADASAFEARYKGKLAELLSPRRGEAGRRDRRV
jgi:oligoendopeptidase F